MEAAGFDSALNIARGGLAVEATGYPIGAVQFHLDTVIKDPVVVPGDREISLVPRPLITVSYATEIGEYSGDTHPGVTIISAKLDGVDVTSEFTAASASRWSFRPGDLMNEEHTLEVVGRDDAGNVHSPIVRVFSVDAPPATPTPVPTETPIQHRPLRFRRLLKVLRQRFQVTHLKLLLPSRSQLRQARFHRNLILKMRLR